MGNGYAVGLVLDVVGISIAANLIIGVDVL